MELGSAAWWTRLQTEPARLAAEVCLIDVAHLDRVLETHAGLRAWVGAVHEAAQIEWEKAKWELTKTRATVLLESKAALDPQSKKGKTVAVVDAEVEVDPRVVAAQVAVFAAQEKRGALRAMCDALSDRRDCLVQIAAKQRDERKEYS